MVYRICGGYGTTKDPTGQCYEHALGDDSWTLSDYTLSEARLDHARRREQALLRLPLFPEPQKS